MFASDNGIGGFHNDVLNAFPTDDESALKLVEEIKNRAKGCISSQNYPGAISLYSKAIEICPTESVASKAILYSNRSLCHFSMSSSDLAIEDAGHSIVADPSYLKVQYLTSLPSHLTDLSMLFGWHILNGQTVSWPRYRLFPKEWLQLDIAILLFPLLLYALKSIWCSTVCILSLSYVSSNIVHKNSFFSNRLHTL